LGQIQLNVNDPAIPSDASNTAYKAAARFLEQNKLRGGVDIRIQKNIPSGAGLGGGSSNAATVLLALNELYDFPLGASELADIAAGIGADVPFFLENGCAMVKGVGERVLPFQVHPTYHQEPVFVVLCSPAVHVSTKDAYRLWDEQGSGRGKEPAKLLQCLVHGQKENLSASLFNSFESVIYPAYPELNAVYETFVSLSPAKPLLSGSGSNLFSLHPTEEEAYSVSAQLRSKGYKATVCELIL
jgi:4-diphosphocytidyl-2-C-methyl-D-erythritol kinase